MLPMPIIKRTITDITRWSTSRVARPLVTRHCTSLTNATSQTMNAQIRHYSSTGERPVTNNNTLRAVAGVCGTAVIAGGTYYLWRRYYTTSKSTKSSSSAKDKSSSWPFLLPTSEEITRRLRAREHSVDLPFHPLIQRIDRAQLPSNNPCEDYYCQHALSDGTGYLFGVFDGHSGTACAKWVSKILPARIAEAFARLPKDADAATKGKAMEEAFVSTDDEIVHGSIKRLQTLGMKRPGEINDDKELEETSTWLERALNGSCALVTYVNTQDREVTVALTGDSRVIVGRQNEQGRWQAKVLSEDQTAHNPSERKRIMSEHPGEDDTILARNRVLGGLQPLRAFGDARYKWSLDIQRQIIDNYFPQLRILSSVYKTPPYVTARPVITTHKIEANDRFMVIATDGLYDDLSNDEIIEVVAGHLDEKARLTEKWSYEDKNVATSLVRNAFGGLDTHKTAQLLSIPAPRTRNFRDDITILVILFGEPHQARVWQDNLKETATPVKGVSPSA